MLEYSDEELRRLINESSAVKKCRVGKAHPGLRRKGLEIAYAGCQRFAYGSIIEQLTKYPSSRRRRVEVDCRFEKFVYLVRACRDFRSELSQDYLSNVMFLKFSIITEQSVLERRSGQVLFGYRNTVEVPGIRYVREYNPELEMMEERLSDFEDLVQRKTNAKFPPQLSARVCNKRVEGRLTFRNFLAPEAVIAIEQETDDDYDAADGLGLPIVVLHPRF